MNNPTPLSAFQRPVSRRNLVRGAAGIAAIPALASLLTACGGSGGSTGATRDLHVLLWPGLFEQSLPRFEKENDVNLTMTPQVDPIQSANLIKSQPGEIDVAVFGMADTPILYENLAAELDLSRVQKSWDSQYPFFRDMWDPAVFAPEIYGGKIYTLAAQWGSSVLVYNTDHIPGEVTSWSIMGDPEFKGRTAFVDQAAEMFGTLALTAGRSASELTEEAFAEAGELAESWLQNAKMLWSTGDDVKQLMVQEEISVAYMWDGTARQLVQEGYPINYVYPEEGVRGYVDGVGIMATSENEDAAYDFLNFSLSKEFGVEVAEATLYASGNQEVAAALSAETREIMRMDEMEKALEEGRMLPQKVTADEFVAVDEWWREIKLRNQV